MLPTPSSPLRPSEQVRRDYAQLCALDSGPIRQHATIERALREYEKLCAHPDIQMIGVRLDKAHLYVGTRLIHARRLPNEPWREIGEFVVTIGKRPNPNFACFNITRSVNDYYHPHVTNQGVMCVVHGMETIRLAIADGELYRASHIIINALKRIDIGAFSGAGAEEWPLAKFYS